MKGKSEKRKKTKTKKNQAEIQLLTSTIQMVQKSSQTDSYSPYFGHIKVFTFVNGFLGGGGRFCKYYY